VPDSAAEPRPLPGDFYNTTFTRGALLATPGDSVRVSATGSHAQTVFNDINSTYNSDFATFSGGRIFSPLGSNVTDVTFTTPGSGAPATVRGFGAIFVNVETASTSSIEYFDPSGATLGRFFAPVAGNQGFSFEGVLFSNEKVGRVRITSGTDALSPSTDDAPGSVPPVNVVALDDLSFAEPQALPGPTLAVTSPAEGATVTSARQTISGTATDPYGVRSLSVNGQPVAVGADGSWSTPATLHDGPNQLTVVATNTGGASSTLVRNVTLANPTLPSNRFTLRSIRVSKSGKGVAIVTLPGPGKIDLILSAARPVGRLVHLERTATAAGNFRMDFKIPSRAKKLLKTRRVRAVEKVSFTPTGGTSATHSVAVAVGTKKKHR
jgi:hypothetical protein